MRPRVLVGMLLLGWGSVVGGCGGPVGPDPTPGGATPTPDEAEGARVLSFRAVPASIIQGDPFTLEWSARGGLVSLSLKGTTPFVVGLPAAGSHVVASSSAGYPTSVGPTVYEVIVGDAGVHAETVVSVQAKPTPEPPEGGGGTPPPPTIRLAGDASCYPVHAASEGCDVTVAATVTNTTSIAWGGCCAGGSGTSALCHVPSLGAYSCTATAIGAGGSANATPHDVAGTNATPTLGPVVVDPTSVTRVPPGCTADVTFTFEINDEERVAACPRIEAAPSPAVIKSSQCPVPGSPLVVRVVLTTQPGVAGVNYVTLTVRDPWGVESGSRSAAVSVNACP